MNLGMSHKPLEHSEVERVKSGPESYVGTKESLLNCDKKTMPEASYYLENH